MNIGPLIERPDSPQINGIGNDRTVTRLFNVDKSVNIDDYIPAKGAVSPDGDGFFLNPSIKTKPGYNIVAFSYAASLGSPTAKEKGRRTNSTDYDLNVNIVEKKLATHSAYRVKWNHDLYGWSSNTTAPTEPLWWTGAKTRADATGVAAAGGFYWSKTRPGDSKTGYWHKIKDMTKFDVEGYPRPQPVVTASKYCKRESVAEAFLPSVIALGAPDKTYGWSGNNSKWLKFPVSISNDGEWFIATVEYQYADSWDEDLYS